MFTQGPLIAPMERRASRHLVHLEQEHNRLARRALGAATKALEELILSDSREPDAISILLADGQRASAAAETVLQHSDAALLAAVVAYNACVQGTSEPAFARQPRAAA